MYELSVKGLIILQSDDFRLIDACREYYECMFPASDVTMIKKEVKRL